MADVVEVSVLDNGTTTVVERDYTADEKANHAAVAKEQAEQFAAAEAAKNAALEKLFALGLTPDDLVALGL